MRVIETPLPGVLLIEAPIYRDGRGSFRETFHAERFAELGLPTEFPQDNHARSVKGVLRGMHFQHPRAQGKLVTVTRGAVFDVAADIRVGSPTFGQWYGVTLSEDEPLSLWVPPGFAHGYYVLSDVADFIYKCTDVYVREYDRAVNWRDPTLAIEWPSQDPILSEKDRAAPELMSIVSDLPRYAE